MQIPDLLACAMAVALASAATWAVCRLRYGHRLKAMQRRLDKLNQARLLYDRHGAQVRRQLEHLKRELDLQRSQQPWAPTPPVAPSTAAVRTPAYAAGAAVEAGFDPPPLPADGFAATQPLTGGGFEPTRPMPTDGFAATRPMPADGFAPTRPMHSTHGAADGPPSLPPDGFAPTRPMPRPARPAHNAPRATGMERLRQVG